MAETWKQRGRRIANRVLQRVGLHVSRRQQAFDMEGLLARAAARTPAIATWIDVGASDGAWSLQAQRLFPSAHFVLFEPLHERQAALASLRSRHGFEIIPAAAGATPGEIAFAIDPQLDGSGVAALGATGTRPVPVETIDHIVGAHALSGPYGIKLDTHGHEVAVLEGAAGTLSSVELLVIEAYNFTLMPGCLRFHELCAWLEQRGFRCCDLADPMRRPRDGALWQMDLAFVPAASPMFASDSFG